MWLKKSIWREQGMKQDERNSDWDDAESAAGAVVWAMIGWFIVLMAALYLIWHVIMARGLL
jgi:hypothetical protein